MSPASAASRNASRPGRSSRAPEYPSSTYSPTSSSPAAPMCSRSSASCEPMVPRSACASVDTRAYSAALTAGLRPAVSVPQQNPRMWRRRGGTRSPRPAPPPVDPRAVTRPDGPRRATRRQTPARRWPGDQPGQAAPGEPGGGQTFGQPATLKHLRAQRFVVDLRRLDRRPERPGAHRPRTRSTVRRCNHTPNRSATCSAI